MPVLPNRRARALPSQSAQMLCQCISYLKMYGLRKISSWMGFIRLLANVCFLVPSAISPWRHYYFRTPVEEIGKIYFRNQAHSILQTPPFLCTKFVRILIASLLNPCTHRYHLLRIKQMNAYCLSVYMCQQRQQRRILLRNAGFSSQRRNSILVRLRV